MNLEFPVHLLSIYKMRAYCNWLTRKEFGADVGMCYADKEIEVRRNNLKENVVVLEPVENHTSLTGYRLPTDWEWEYACRADSMTRHYTGTGEKSIHLYEWIVTNSDGFGRPPALKRPNAFGLFDMLGNVSELVGDSFVGLEGDPNVDQATMRGVNFWNKATPRSAKRSIFPIRVKQPYMHTAPTFRVARTIKRLIES
ncbi:MAG: SUMF1/EgtB/PvdO family nonheme iron enzyme [Verrucomicrobiota bacterium]